MNWHARALGLSMAPATLVVGGTRSRDGCATLVVEAIIRGMSQERSVFAWAKLIACCTLLSRVTGLIREMLLAQTFGLRWVLDSFNFAFQIPNLFRRLLGEGAMAAVFVPTFTRTLEKDGRPTAWRVLARTLALLTLTLLAIIVVIAVVIAVIWFLAIPADPEALASRRLILGLTALMLPFMLTVCVLALFSAILNCVGSFVPAALAPVLLNLCMIAGIAWLGPAISPEDPNGQIYVVALTVVAAGVLQIAFILVVLRLNNVPLGWRFEPRDPTVRQMLHLLVPVALGQGVLAFGVFLDAGICTLLTHKTGTPTTMSLLGGEIAYPLEEGALSAITCAQRLYQFPLGVLVISLATAAMPVFSRLAAREDWRAWKVEVRQSLRLAVFEGILSGTMMIVLAVPIVRFLFEYNRFTPENTSRAAHVLVFYGLARWAYCAQHIVLRGFYSYQDVHTPLKISITVLPLNVLLTLSLLWFDSIREAAFALSSMVTSGLSVIVGLIILQRRTGQRLIDPALASAVVRMLLAAVVAGLSVQGLWRLRSLVEEALPGGVVLRFVETMVPLFFGVVVFLGVAWMLRLPEVGLLLAHGRRPVRKE
ncbi:MAG: murein biosynthesis integral membrane protein MurJ [Planctomycetota bacterium]